MMLETREWSWGLEDNSRSDFSLCLCHGFVYNSGRTVASINFGSTFRKIH